MNTFSDNLRNALHRRGWTIQDLADNSGIHRPNLSRILNGKENVTLQRAEVIAHAIGCELSELLSKNFKKTFKTP